MLNSPGIKPGHVRHQRQPTHTHTTHLLQLTDDITPCNHRRDNTHNTMHEHNPAQTQQSLQRENQPID